VTQTHIPSIQQAATHPLTFVRENWPWFAPLVYGYVSLVGMVQSWLQLRAFGINVFDYAELNDFLLAAFREPTALLAALGIVAYGGLFVLVGVYFQRKRTRFGSTASFSKYQRWFNYVMFPLVVVIAPFYGPLLLDGAGKGRIRESVMNDRARIVSVQIKDLVEPSYSKDQWIRDARFIGMSGKYLFLYVAQDKVLILPTANCCGRPKTEPLLRSVPT
jgi:hypothetical protein